MKRNYIFVATLIMLVSGISRLNAQCADSNNVHSFQYNGKTYEIVSEKKSWKDAASCALERGGYLAQIDDLAEQQAIANEVLSVVDTQYTTVSDGGNAAYVWIGANDLLAEGNWLWDGDDSGATEVFWVGDETGTPYMGKYNNWGKSGATQNEPDNYMNNQNAGAMGLQKWPVGFPQVFGTPGQWNDINQTNQLYYVIEQRYNTSVEYGDMHRRVNIYPNPAKGRIYIDEIEERAEITLYDMTGEVKRSLLAVSGVTVLNTESLTTGIYLLHIRLGDGSSAAYKVVVE